MSHRPPTRGIVVPYFQEVVREFNGYPVVVRMTPWTPLDAHRHWGRFR